MKRTLIASILAIAASTTLLHADVVDGIQMVSQSYNISAQWIASYLWNPPGSLPVPSEAQPYPPGDWSAGYQVSQSGYGTSVVGGYNLSSTDGSPVAASTSAPGPSGSPLGANASIDRFSFYNYASCAAWGNLSFYWGTSPPLGGTLWFGVNGTIQTSAQGIWNFQPTGSQLNVSIDGGFGNQCGNQYSGLTVLLQDMTSPTTLLNLVDKAVWSSATGSPPETDFTFAVDPSHVYEFSISGWSNTFDEDWAYESVTASITSVPEPGVCFLLSLGLAGLLGFKTRFSS